MIPVSKVGLCFNVYHNCLPVNCLVRVVSKFRNQIYDLKKKKRRNWDLPGLHIECYQIFWLIELNRPSAAGNNVCSSVLYACSKMLQNTSENEKETSKTYMFCGSVTRIKKQFLLKYPVDILEMPQMYTYCWQYRLALPVELHIARLLAVNT